MLRIYTRCDRGPDILHCTWLHWQDQKTSLKVENWHIYITYHYFYSFAYFGRHWVGNNRGRRYIVEPLFFCGKFGYVCSGLRSQYLTGPTRENRAVSLACAAWQQNARTSESKKIGNLKRCSKNVCILYYSQTHIDRPHQRLHRAEPKFQIPPSKKTYPSINI